MVNRGRIAWQWHAGGWRRWIHMNEWTPSPNPWNGRTDEICLIDFVWKKNSWNACMQEWLVHHADEQSPESLENHTHSSRLLYHHLLFVSFLLPMYSCISIQTALISIPTYLLIYLYIHTHNLHRRISFGSSSLPSIQKIQKTRPKIANKKPQTTDHAQQNCNKVSNISVEFCSFYQ